MHSSCGHSDAHVIAALHGEMRIMLRGTNNDAQVPNPASVLVAMSYCEDPLLEAENCICSWTLLFYLFYESVWTSGGALGARLSFSLTYGLDIRRGLQGPSKRLLHVGNTANHKTKL